MGATTRDYNAKLILTTFNSLEGSHQKRLNALSTASGVGRKTVQKVLDHDFVHKNSVRSVCDGMEKLGKVVDISKVLHNASRSETRNGSDESALEKSASSWVPSHPHRRIVTLICSTFDDDRRAQRELLMPPAYREELLLDVGKSVQGTTIRIKPDAHDIDSIWSGLANGLGLEHTNRNRDSVELEISKRAGDGDAPALIVEDWGLAWVRLIDDSNDLHQAFESLDAQFRSLFRLECRILVTGVVSLRMLLRYLKSGGSPGASTVRVSGPNERPLEVSLFDEADWQGWTTSLMGNAAKEKDLNRLRTLANENPSAFREALLQHRQGTGAEKMKTAVDASHSRTAESIMDFLPAVWRELVHESAESGKPLAQGIVKDSLEQAGICGSDGRLAVKQWKPCWKVWKEPNRRSRTLPGIA